MEVFLDLVSFTAFRRRKWRQGGKFLLRLTGVAISTSGAEVTVEPVYTPLVAIDQRGSLTYIEIGWRKPRLLLVVSSAWPFVHIERMDCIVLEDE